jgi:hypothetical protein
MTANLEKIRKDLDRLIDEGARLHNALQYETMRDSFLAALGKSVKDEKRRKSFLKELPSFYDTYQSWYSEALACVGWLIPNRLEDFRKLYEIPKSRKEIRYGTYVIEDALKNLRVTEYDGEVKVDSSAAIPLMRQQYSILSSASRRLESSLFDVRLIVQADLFDNELEAATELIKKGFVRGAGAIAAVVLEAHLAQVCENHHVTVRKKNPTINDYSQALKDADVIETPVWRKIQVLADIRNKCEHKKQSDPTAEEVQELVDGVGKITKNLF